MFPSPIWVPSNENPIDESSDLLFSITFLHQINIINISPGYIRGESIKILLWSTKRHTGDDLHLSRSNVNIILHVVNICSSVLKIIESRTHCFYAYIYSSYKIYRFMVPFKHLFMLSSISICQIYIISYENISPRFHIYSFIIYETRLCHTCFFFTETNYD